MFGFVEIRGRAVKKSIAPLGTCSGLVSYEVLMKIIWQIEPEEIIKIKDFVRSQLDNPFVQQRVQLNLAEDKSSISIDRFWYIMVSCLLSSQQRSGPDAPVSRFILLKPFPLSYEFCKTQEDLSSYIFKTLSDFGGIRFTNTLAGYLNENFYSLGDSLWQETSDILEGLRFGSDVQMERKAAIFIDEHFKGFGPKQSRNLIQSLGLTRYEIPVDSRITRWLNDFGFPVKLTADALSDRDYFEFIADGIQQLCVEAHIYPCVLDAAIFASFDGDKWTEENLIW